MERLLGAAETWDSSHLVEFLPTLLISLALFFIALTDYLWEMS